MFINRTERINRFLCRSLSTSRFLAIFDLVKTLSPRRKSLCYNKAISHQFGSTSYLHTEFRFGHLRKLSSMADSNDGPVAKHRKTTEFTNSDKNRLIWIDLEMTGLDVQKDTILEIACIVTEGNLEIVAEGPHLIIHHDDKVLDGMNEWCIDHHGKSGLTEAVRNSKISLQEAETEVLDFIAQHTPAGICPIAGNSVGTDKFFIDRHMPRLSSHFHYRIVDVSTVKEICRRWYPDTLKQAPPKKLTHRALDDIKESIQELSFYRSSIFK